MKLEVGKVYADRMDDTWLIIGQHPANGRYIGAPIDDSDEFGAWCENGALSEDCVLNVENNYDLIKQAYIPVWKTIESLPNHSVLICYKECGLTRYEISIYDLSSGGHFLKQKGQFADEIECDCIVWTELPKFEE